MVRVYIPNLAWRILLFEYLINLKLTTLEHIESETERSWQCIYVYVCARANSLSILHF